MVKGPRGQTQRRIARNVTPRAGIAPALSLCPKEPSHAHAIRLPARTVARRY